MSAGHVAANRGTDCGADCGAGHATAAFADLRTEQRAGESADHVPRVQIGCAGIGHFSRGIGAGGSADGCGCDAAIAPAYLCAEQTAGGSAGGLGQPVAGRC